MENCCKVSILPLFLLLYVSQKLCEISVFKNINSDFCNFTVFCSLPGILLEEVLIPFCKFMTIFRPRIKPPFANRDNFPEIRGEDCDPFSVIRG